MTSDSPRPGHPDFAATIDAALTAIDPTMLRAVVRAAMPILGARTQVLIGNALIDQAARADGWLPPGPSKDEVRAICAAAATAVRKGSAAASAVDGHLQMAMNAFVRRDYAAALRIYRAWLLPLERGQLDLGQDELIEDALVSDLHRCAAQYLVSHYLAAAPERRPEAVLTALADVKGIAAICTPLADMEGAAVEPLPEWNEFLGPWCAAVARRLPAEREHAWDTDDDHRYREAVRRVEGIAGLARLARATRRSGDLQAWCKALVEARDWQAAIVAHQEAAAVVSETWWRGHFLDGAARAARELAHDDAIMLLEKSWRTAPTLPRLRRWLGSTDDKTILQARAQAALAACPARAPGQRAVLLVLNGDLIGAAALLRDAPALAWSDSEHPGRLLFPLFLRLLANRGEDDDTLAAVARDADEAREPDALAARSLAEILAVADGGAPAEDGIRAAMLSALRAAAERRVAAVTEHKRRRHYGHAAALVVACARVDPSPTTTSWLTGILDAYRRYPALMVAFQRLMVRPG